MRLERATSLFVTILESLGLLSLMGTEDLLIPVFIFLGILSAFQVTGIFLNRWIRLPNKVTLAGFAILIVGALLGYFKFQLHPVLIAAHLGPAVQFLLWMNPSSTRNWAWRIGLAFIEMVTAIALSPELYLAGLLFLFIIFTSVSISCLFMQIQFAKNAPKELGMILPRPFLVSSFALSALIFTGSLIIFPILPRLNSEMSMGLGDSKTSKVSYTENLDLSKINKLTGNGEGEVVLSVFIPTEPGIPQATYWIPGGFLRSKSLDVFDGSRWRTDEKDNRVLPRKEYQSLLFENSLVTGDFRNKHSNHWVIELIREPLEYPILPLPYGIKALQMETREYGNPVRLKGQEWILPDSINHRIQYRAAVGIMPGFDRPPNPHHFEVPEEWKAKDSRLFKLSQQIFESEKTPEGKVTRLKKFFESNGFGLSTNFAESVNPTELKAKTHPAEKTLTYLESFLFRAKAGHCELYATSTAILLRMAGIPTRLISGFKTLRKAVNGVITVRTGDAHAWNEVWIKGRGWVPVDFTPVRTGGELGFLSGLRDLRESLSAHWYRYIVRYTPNVQKEVGIQAAQRVSEGFKTWLSHWTNEKIFSKEFLEAMTPTLLLLIFFSLGFYLFKSGRVKKWMSYDPRNSRWNRYVPRALQSRRKRLIRILKKAKIPSERQDVRFVIEKIQETDLKLRFGSIPQSSSEFESEIQGLDQKIKELKDLTRAS